MPGPETTVYALDAAGWCAGARRLASPHHDERPPGAKVELIVIHNISLPPGEFGGRWIDDLFLGRLDPGAHPYFRDARRARGLGALPRSGATARSRSTCACEARAWHAGASTWSGRERCNDFSVGIELEGADDVPFAEPQYDTLARLTRALFTRYGALELAGHSDIAPGPQDRPRPLVRLAAPARGPLSGVSGPAQILRRRGAQGPDSLPEKILLGVPCFAGAALLDFVDAAFRFHYMLWKAL